MNDTASALPVLQERHGHVLLVTLNRPERLNAVNLVLYEELVQVLDAAAGDGDVRAIVLTGAGRGFCSGADLKAHAEGPPTDEERGRYTDLAQEANRLLQEGPAPVIAAVNGPAIGAGLELALSSDLMVVHRETVLRLPEVSLGTFVGGGVAYTLCERIGIAKARELVYFGDSFSGAEALEWGIANRAVAQEEVLAEALAWAERLAQQAPLSLRAAKRLMGPAARRSPREALQEERAALEEIFGSDDWQEGVRAFHEKRPPRYRGA